MIRIESCILRFSMKGFCIIMTFCIYTSTFSQIKYHDKGKGKEKTIAKPYGFKNGESLFYADDGKLDSSVSLKNGKLNGLTKVYYSDDDIFYFEYKNDSLVSHRIYDSTHKLKYESPLNLNPIPKTTFHFSSGRNYYDTSKSDTLRINQDVPYMNQWVYFPGATVIPIDKYSWEVKAWKPQPKTKSGKMVVDIYDFIVENSHVLQKTQLLREEIILIPLKL